LVILFCFIGIGLLKFLYGEYDELSIRKRRRIIQIFFLLLLVIFANSVLYLFFGIADSAVVSPQLGPSIEAGKNEQAKSTNLQKAEVATQTLSPPNQADPSQTNQTLGLAIQEKDKPSS